VIEPALVLMANRCRIWYKLRIEMRAEIRRIHSRSGVRQFM